MRSTAVILLACMGTVAHAGEADRDDEARVLQATSGRPVQQTRGPAPRIDVAPAHLDGAALEAWYVRRHGAQRPAVHPASPNAPDDQAEAVLLADIERRRHAD